MDDDNGLELSLGLSFGGSSGKGKGKSDGSNVWVDDTDRGSRIVSAFKNFLNPAIPRHESVIGSESDLAKPPENFFNDLSKATADAETSSLNLSARNLWLGGNYPPAASEEEKEPGTKRKRLFDELNKQKWHETEAYADGQDRSKTPHITIATEEGSTADNEDVADSEIDASTSKPAARHDFAKKHHLEFRNEIQGQKSLNDDNEFKVGNSGYGAPFVVQPAHLVDGTPIGASVVSGHSLHGLMQIAPAVNGERPETWSGTPANVPIMFGYSPVQLPTLDKDNSWGLMSHSQPLNAPHTAQTSGVPRTLTELNPHNGKSLGPSTAEGKNIIEEGFSSHIEEKAKGKVEGSSSTFDFSAIKPGIATEVKFGGCGSYPNLPWVSTTAPNGRTISGVTYKYNGNQIRIVCACHGTHLSPEEFVRHAAEDHPNQDGNNGMSNFPTKNPGASAQC